MALDGHTISRPFRGVDKLSTRLQRTGTNKREAIVRSSTGTTGARFEVTVESDLAMGKYLLVFFAPR